MSLKKQGRHVCIIKQIVLEPEKKEQKTKNVFRRKETNIRDVRKRNYNGLVPRGWH